MTKPKIWHLVSNRWNSAIAEYALQTSRALRDLEYPTLITPLAERPLANRATEHGLAVEAVSSFRPKLEVWQRLKEIRTNFQPDILIVYGGQETFFSRFLAAGRPILRFRGQNEDVLKTGHLLSRFGQKSIQALLAPSQAVASRLRQSWRTPVFVVPLGCDRERFYHQSEAFRKLQRPSLQIVGRLDPIKGHQRFFYFFRELLRRWPSDFARPYLEIIGEAANVSNQELRQIASSLQLVEGVDWALIDRRLPDIGAAMSAAHLGVICSLGSEVICRVAEEYLLCGTPIFVSGVGSLEECLFHKRAGASYRGLDMHAAVDLLSQQLLQAYQETSEQRQERAQAAALHFSRQRMGERLSEVIANF
ncbi:MAG: glycosyltransferase [Oligoflexus sp.]